VNPRSAIPRSTRGTTEPIYSFINASKQKGELYFEGFHFTLTRGLITQWKSLSTYRLGYRVLAQNESEGLSIVYASRDL